jgi:hypothetical protein
MKNCTHCSRELKGYKKSAEIPTRKNHYYIICSDCGKVMIAEMETKKVVRDGINKIRFKIVTLFDTPVIGEEANRMRKEALALFEEVGINPYKNSYTIPTSTEEEIEDEVSEEYINSLEEPEEEIEDEEINCFIDEINKEEITDEEFQMLAGELIAKEDDIVIRISFGDKVLDVLSNLLSKIIK